MTLSTCQVAVVGAGPYGLACAAHLRSARVDIRVFGEPMGFWARQMPVGMCLRSSWEASHISDPDHILTLDRFQKVEGRTLQRPIPLSDFIAYGKWFQTCAAPKADRRLIRRIESAQPNFRLVLNDDDEVIAERVILATGLDGYAFRPPEFASLPESLVSHTADHADLQRFANQRVGVVGGGQSAIETAALLREAGADVELIIRAPSLRWLSRSHWLHNNVGRVRYVLYPPTDVGPPVLNQIVAQPDLFRRLPRSLQTWVAYRSIRPAAAGWLRKRVAGIPMTFGRQVVSVLRPGEGVMLMLDDGSKRHVHHVMLATGYRIDVRKHPLLSPELQAGLRTTAGYPDLDAGFETSNSGLHFVGAPAARSFGPLMRFVSGTTYTASVVARRVCGVGSSG